MKGRPGKCTSVAEARQLQDNWVDTRAKEIDRAMGFTDCREFWYSIEELQEYIDYVKEKSNEQGMQNPGLRIYFAAYARPGNNNDKATVFLAPTKFVSGKNENNYDIDPLNSSTGGTPPEPY